MTKIYSFTFILLFTFQISANDPFEEINRVLAKDGYIVHTVLTLRSHYDKILNFRNLTSRSALPHLDATACLRP